MPVSFGAYLWLLRRGQPRADPRLGPAEHIDRLRAEDFLDVLRRLYGPAAGLANNINRLLQIDLARQCDEIGQREIHGAFGVDIGELVGFADVDKLGVFWHFGDLY